MQINHIMVEYQPRNVMIARNSAEKLKKALGQHPVVLVNGARQTGKSTLVKHVAPDYTYITFDDLRFLSAAQSDPIGFIEGLKHPVILDEIQRVPELFLAIKYDVDKNRHPGRYLLTGSANPLLIPQLGDSLAGRMAIINLFPLSQGEIEGVKESFIDTIFDNRLPQAFDKLSTQELYSRLAKGGYPLVQQGDFESRESWFNGYITLLLQRDIKDLAHITGIAEFPRLLYLLATRTCNLMNSAEVSRTSGLSTSTLSRYLILLETIFLIHFLPAWSVNRGKRLVKSPKITLIDSALIGYLLGLDLQDPTTDSKILGSVLENFVVNELQKQLTWCRARANMFHYRTSNGIEVDLILENSAGKIVALEIKKSATVTAHDFKGLRHLMETEKDAFVQGIIVYTGTEYIPFGSRLCALPISALWA